MPINQPESDLARVKSQEMDTTWPVSMEIVLWWEGPKGKPVSTKTAILANEFFGHGQHGAPLNGEALIGRIERLRRQGPPKGKSRGKA